MTASAFKVACPKCEAAIGQPCSSPGREQHVVHLARRAVANRLAGEYISAREERELKRFGLPTFQISPPRGAR
jgi:3-deoxy-D-manno-octulosonic acid (KDO) 8-phosphate synthase